MSKMRPRRLPAFRPTSADPRLCARRFGGLIRHCRDLDGRPLEELAPLAGLAPAEWEAIEAGRAPDTVEQVLLLATALRLGDSWLVPLLRLCARAQEKY
jgi:Helix-turn-helix domain